MRERKLFMVLGIVLAVLALGIAYAATLNVNLSITGTATAMASEENFDVKFTYVSPVTGTGEVDTSGSTAEISSDPTRGTFEFTGFITKGQTQSATWTISNENEAELYAHIVAYRELEVADREYFRGRCDLASDVIEPNGTTTLTVTVECIKTPTSGTVKSGVMEFGFSAIASADEELEKDEEGNPIIPPGVIPTVPTVNVEVSNITSTGATITAVGTDAGGDELQYTLKLNDTIYEGPSTTNTWNLSNLTDNTTYTYVVEVTDGKYKAAATGEFKTLLLEIIPTTTPYVGCYADMDRDGTIDGVIFADHGYGMVGTSPWGDSWGPYSVTKITSGLKQYYVSQESYTNSNWGTHEVISPVEETSGTDRFYVMALSDFTTSSYSTFYWYSAAYGNLDSSRNVGTTTDDFGTGKSNTIFMVSAINAGTYGTGVAQDLWKAIQNNGTYDIITTENDSGKWFVPSKGEWSAFGGELGITSSNYSSTYGLSRYYWSSSQGNTYDAYIANFRSGYMGNDSVDDYYCVRLCATF